jgi:hypothetical protein
VRSKNLGGSGPVYDLLLKVIIDFISKPSVFATADFDRLGEFAFPHQPPQGSLRKTDSPLAQVIVIQKGYVNLRCL